MADNIQDYNNLKDRMNAFEVPNDQEDFFCIWMLSEILKKHGEFENYQEEISVLFQVVKSYNKVKDREFKKLQKRIEQIQTN
tara:strand:+ start:271 stop:516 length:246 start_codon:yes stop_codon:yes gene_type:complete